MKSIILICICVFCATSAAAFERVTDRSAFAALMAGYDIKRALVRLNVSQDGQITGRGFGRAITGEWDWRDGYFCRSMNWGREPLPYNCQAVYADGMTIRFRSDKGTGDYADFRRVPAQ